jgi:chromate transporter
MYISLIFGVSLAKAKRVAINKSLSDMTLLEKLWRLLYTTLSVSAVAFGGGFVVLPMLKKVYVEKYSWINSVEYNEIIAIAQSAPGTIAGNTSMVIGFKIAGVLGAVATMLGNVLPPLVIITAVYYAYTSLIQNQIVGYFMAGMQAGIAAVIFDFVIRMLKDLAIDKNAVFSLIVMLGAFAASFFFEFSVIYIMLAAVGLGIGFLYIRLYAEKKKANKETRGGAKGGGNEFLP